MDFQFSFKKMPTGGTLFDTEKLNNICRTYFSRLTAEEIYDNSIKYYEKYDKDFYNIITKNKEALISFLNIERDGKRPRKDIATYKDIKIEASYIFNELFYSDNTYSDIEKKEDLDVLNKYIEIYNIEDTQDEWYQKVQQLAEENGYAKSTKEYKENPNNYKGHIGTICEMIRHAVTGRKQTPNLYDILKILGGEEIKKRIEFYQK